MIDLMNCESVIHVPVFDTAAKDLENNEKDINDVFDGGFELGFKTDNDQCSRCEGSGGKCGLLIVDSFAFAKIRPMQPRVQRTLNQVCTLNYCKLFKPFKLRVAVKL